jgi:N-acetylneuraminic acid mutarotase
LSANATYRLRVLVAGSVLGFADVKVYANHQEVKELSTGNEIALINGRTLPVKFRIEQGRVSVLTTSGGAATVPGAGGTVATSDGGLVVDVPAQGTPLDLSVLQQTGDVSAEGGVPGSVYELGPDNTAFDPPVTVTVRVAPSTIPAGFDENDLQLYHIIDDIWWPLDGVTHDPLEHTFAGRFSHFSAGGVAVQAGSVTVAPGAALVGQGQSLQLSARVYDDFGSEIAKRGVTWASSNPGLGSVNQSGLVSLLSPGSVTIAATAENKKQNAQDPVGAASLTIAARNTWTTLPPPPTVRQLLGVVASGDLLHTIGGVPFFPPGLTTHEVYDGTTGAWRTLAPLPAPRYYSIPAAHQGKIYYPGGFDGSGYRAELFIYDEASDSWSQGPSMPFAANVGGAAVIGTDLYVVTSGEPSSVYRTRLLRFSIPTGVWTELSIPQTQYLPAVGALDGKLYLAGGWDGSIWIDWLSIYNPTTGTWANGPSLPSPRYGAAAAVIGSQLYVIGGDGGPTRPQEVGTNTVFRYDATTSTWTTLAPVSSPRYASGAAVMRGMIYAAGGVQIGLGPAGMNGRLEAYAP